MRHFGLLITPSVTRIFRDSCERNLSAGGPHRNHDACHECDHAMGISHTAEGPDVDGNMDDDVFEVALEEQ